MKKLTKLFSVFTVFLTVLGSLINIKHLVHAEDTASTTVIVHKIVMNNDDFNKFTYEENLSKYNGSAINNLQTYFGGSAKEVAGVNFKAWQKVETKAEGTKTGIELGIAGDNDNYKLATNYSNGVETTANGATFTLANGIYIFTEDKEKSPYYNQNGSELTGMKAVPFKLELPQAKTDGSGYFDTQTPLHVYPKNTENKPEITKAFTDKANIGDNGVKNVEIGQEIGYTITTKVPKDAAYKTFAWEDTMLKGLDFKLDSLQIADDKGLNLQKITDYTLIQTVRGFMVQLNPDGLARLEEKAKEGEVKFTLTYKATLNDSAKVDSGIPNKVKLIYGNRPSEFSEPKSTTPKDGEITVEKEWDEGLTPIDVKFGIYEKATGVKVDEITLQKGQKSVSKTGLKGGVEYLVIEETDVVASLPDYTVIEEGKIKVKNKKNPNPTPLEPEEPKVITYGKRFVKTDDKELNASTKLLGAEFIVRKEGEEKYLALKATATKDAEVSDYTQKEAAYIVAVKEKATDIDQKKALRDAAYEAMNMQWTWVDSKDGAFKFVSSTDGKFEVKGLVAGQYELIETKAPEGYALLTTTVKFIVGPNTWGQTDDITAENFQQVKNKKVTIPQTGGIGTLVFTVVGLSTMVFAFIAMKKRQSEEA
ncbi:isopeptide-forming domain-containing fimbrial protein [Streptococcus suis]|uniref:Cell wall surface anchor family protein n=1 Tax=Streptococcus suis TaxID=1307 RepID=A0A116PHD1_STRSU|nr:isopeptide-forming domain-containing fimbrial protein [Streptococcus suis]NQP75546.1 isopeptide-forming domain-containing fimbrial protein [Streptococcus suis]NQP77617.1 isopeptide-forming domain-containing fimbrial protein [Streptococcus suis]NQP91958.1 isopeptide-forming domain-containing fimbrial protein [Streptococcus suis]NQP93939.1 isopeptide-forming domain-containing fimbrial protein [Streptococcus suis]NQS64560.1 isopeptide-forming domain-containing fimbrial protein [Streptococcus s